LALHEFNKTLLKINYKKEITYLNQQILEKLLVSTLIFVHLLSDLSSHLFPKFLDVLVDLSHLLDSLEILLLGLFDFQSDFLISELVFVVLSNLLFLLLNVVVLLDGELITHGLFDSHDLLFTVLLNEGNHGVKDLLGLKRIHILIS
jgi:hypothetical protein